MKPDFDAFALPTPCYVVDTARLVKNLEILDGVRKRTGCRILLAQKAFSMFYFYPLIAKYADGTAASGLFEARLGCEHMGGENHIFCTAYREDEFDEILRTSEHLVFNSFSQLEKFGARAKKSGKSVGMRVNPQRSTQDHAIYAPCSPGSRLGVTAENFRWDLAQQLDGLHFHTLCEQNSDALDITLEALERQLGALLPRMKWLNFGGGHHITRPGYDIARLERLITRFSQKYGVQIYLEPGEAFALGTGFLVSTVLDITQNGVQNAILDTSAACHMPDVLEMPYRPAVVGAGLPGEKRHTYRLGGPTCLAGDIIGDYSFDEPLRPGSRIVFEDMAHYTMVKNNTFNGVGLPAIFALDENGAPVLIRQFSYEDFKNRLS